MLRKLKAKKGYSLITFIVLMPLMMYLIVYFISAYSYTRAISRFNQISTAAFDIVLVDGKLTTENRNSMNENFKNMGIDNPSSLKITVVSGTKDLTTGTETATRGEKITMSILYEEPHYFYDVNKFLLGNLVNKKSFYYYGGGTGMSEKYIP